MRWLVMAVILAAFAAAPFYAPSVEFVLTIALASGFAALGVGLLLRAGLITLGHAIFFAFGAYALAVLQDRFQINGLIELVIASTLATTIAGVIVGLFMVRYRSIFFAMLNLAASMVFFAFLSKFYSLTGGSDGISVAEPHVLTWVLSNHGFNHVLFYGSLGVAVLAAFAVQRYMNSPVGQALSGVEANEIRLEYLGISARRVLLTTYTISAALAGLGGAVAALAIGHVFPEMSFWTQSGDFLLMAVLGGITGAVGPFFGAVFIALVHRVANIYVAGYWDLILGVALFVVILLLPQGLYKAGQDVFNWRLKFSRKLKLSWRPKL